MDRKTLGKTGVQIPEVGIGTWSYRAGPEPLRRGLDAGALFIDTAESYGTEEVVRQALAGRRQEVFVATKVSSNHLRSSDLKKSAENSLCRLGIDTIDLLQVHAPNPAIPIDETISALEELVDSGKVRFIGVSNFPLQQLREAQQAFRKYSIVSNQVRYNLIDRTIEKELLPYCSSNGITIIAYSPLARGLERVRDCDPQGVLWQIANETGKTPAQIAINWCVSKAGVVAIPKGNSAEHILENCGASDWRLDSRQLELLDRAIVYRHRGSFDVMLRKYTPPGVRAFGLRVMKYLPRGVRRRLS